jgi:hypothetical protein
MTRTTWAVLLAIDAIAGLGVLFLGTSIPPCFGDASGHISAECLATWEAGRSLFPDRYAAALGGPIPAAAVTFLTLTGVTIVIDLARRRFRRRASDIPRH